MGVKYSLPFKSHDGVQWHVRISTDSYSGPVIIIRGVSEQCAILAYEGETDDPFGVFIKSTLTIKCYNEGTIDVNELQKAQDKDFVISRYREGVLDWTGYMVPEGIENPMKSTPYDLTISAICGLGMLADLPYVHNNLYGTTAVGSRCPMNYVRQILFATTNLGLPLPVRWTNTLQCTAYPGEDVFTGSVEWSPFGEGFRSYQSGSTGDQPGPQQNCEYILMGILQSMQCRIYQANGRWTIRRINDLISPSVLYKQIAGDLGVMVIQLGTENMNTLIGRNGFPFILEDQLMTNSRGIKSCKVTYQANVRENILPNGSQDLVSIGRPIYWGFYSPDGAVVSSDDLFGRKGNSAEISNLGSTDSIYYTMISQGSTLGNDGLPIDTWALIPQINFGFTFSPQNGFPFNPSTGLIDWSSDPLKIKVIFNAGTTKYYLNEFGFWQTSNTDISIIVDGLQIDDIATVNFDKFQGIIMPQPSAQPGAGNTSDIAVMFQVNPGQRYTVDEIYVKIAEANDVYESIYDTSKNTSTDERTLNISSSFGGYMLSNFMTIWSRSDTECFFRDANAYIGTLTGMTANAIMRCKYKPSKIYNGTMSVQNALWSFDQMYMIDGQGSSQFLPINASHNAEKCEVNIVAMESRNDNVIFTEKYYSSNDSQLSN